MRVNYVEWVRRVLAWDAALPAFIALAPAGIELLFPDRRGALEITAVTLPIAAFFLRIRAGKRQIGSNRCTVAFRAAQFWVFSIGILPLVLIECVMVLSHLMPQGAAFATPSDRIVWATLYAIYLSAMAVAMFPGRDRDTRNP